MGQPGHHRGHRPGDGGRGGTRPDHQAARDRQPPRRRTSKPPSSRPPSRPTARSAGPTASPTASRSRPSRWARSGSPGRAPAVPPPAARCSATSSRSRAASGSTWAGLPAATGGAVPAVDPLDGPRRWFAFLPTVAADRWPAAVRPRSGGVGRVRGRHGHPDRGRDPGRGTGRVRRDPARRCRRDALPGR